MSGQAARAPEPRRAPRLGVGSRLSWWLAPGLFGCALLPGHVATGLLVAYNGLLILLWLWDARRLFAVELAVTRELATSHHHLSSVTYHQVIESRFPEGLRLWVEDELPASFERAQSVHRLELAGLAKARSTLSFVPVERGVFTLQETALKIERKWGLSSLTRSLPCADTVRVLPRLPRAEHAPRLRRRQLGSVAARLSHAPRGREFEALREYVPGDSMRDVDWKATAKRGRPVTRTYRPERSQTLWLVLDASRSMTLPSGSGPQRGRAIHHTRFDASVQAALQLADSALRAGDRVGLLVFSSEQELCVPPSRGSRHYVRLLHALTPRRAHPRHFNPRALVQQLCTRARKRALVVVFTDLDNESEADLFIEHAPALTRRHVVTCVSLIDREAEQTLDRVPETDADAFLKAATIDLSNERERIQSRLHGLGVQVAHAHPGALAQAALDQYFAVKLSGRL